MNALPIYSANILTAQQLSADSNNAVGQLNSATGELNASAYLTPDALLVYCQTRLRGIDDQINGTIAQQQQSSAVKDQIAKIQSEVCEGNDYDDAGKVADATSQLNQLEQMPGVSADMKSTIDQIKSTLNAGNDGKVSADEQKNMQDSFQSLSSSVDSGAELNMIQLQSLMSQRQTAVQLTTSMMQTLSDTLKSIADKVGT